LIEVEVVDSADLTRIVDSTLGGPRVVPGTVPAPPATVDPHPTTASAPNASQTIADSGT